MKNSNPFKKHGGVCLNSKYFTEDEILNPQFETYKFRQNQIDALSFVAQLMGGNGEITAQTSGSTGTPKTMTFSKEAVYQSATATNDFFNLNKNSVAVLALPINYIAGKMMVARSIAGEYNLIVRQPSSNPDLSEVKADFMPVTPFQMHNMIDNQPQHVNNISTYLIGGGEPDNVLLKKINEHQINAYASFGMTETLSHFALAHLKNLSQPPVYLPLNGVEIEVGDEGNLLVNWPGITQGQLDTNDIVEKHENGFTWLGRADNVINSGGVKIIPERVEHILKDHILTPFFIGSHPHPTLGQELILFSETALKINLNEIAWDFKHQQPRKIIVVRPFARTASGKIRRHETMRNYNGL